MQVGTEVLQSLADEAIRSGLSEFARSLVARLVAPRLKDRKNESKLLEAGVDRIVREIDPGRFGRQIADGATWAGMIQVQGMATPIDTGSSTIELDMAPIQRRFRASDRPDHTIGERDLVNSSSSFLVLGDPGSGKTTTLKRLTLAMFDSIPTDPAADLAFPIVVLCREVNWHESGLLAEIAERAGVDLSKVCRALEAPSSEHLPIVAALMDQLKCLLIIDGLDEVNPEFRPGVVETTARLHRQLRVSRIVCSSRSGDAPHLEGFSTAELLPLTPEQRVQIVERRLGSNRNFFLEVERASIDQRLLDRPLFLNHLIRVFEATGAVADRPSDLYSQLVRLMIHDWDEQRRVKRRAGIRGLDATTIEGVLRHLAFRLTKDGLAVFGESDLLGVLEELGQQFEIQTRNATRFLRELQAHAGFLAETPSGFQFAHFTLQEHLCAHYIVLRPNHKSIERLLRQNPEVAAVAVALSSHPTDWLIDRVQSRTFETPGQVTAFLSRLAQERPRFIESGELGQRLLDLMTRSSPSDGDIWARLAAVDPVLGSVTRATRGYHASTHGEWIQLSLRRDRPEADGRRIPRYRVPRNALEPFSIPPD